MRILLVEDDKLIGDGIKAGLSKMGFSIDWFTAGLEGKNALYSAPYDAAILDLTLPGIDGLDILREWRDKGRHEPVLILTARDALSQRVEGLRLGADVPVFTRGRAAFAEGVGEKLTPVDIPEPWYLVLVPQVLVSTAEIFSDPLLTRDSPAIKVRTVLEGDSRNDCQPVVERRYPEVRNALILLNKFVSARLTGTGGCVFGSFPNKAEADKVSALLPDHLQRFVAKGSNVSMLHRKLETLV